VSGAQARTVFVVGRPTVVGNRGFIDLGNGTTAGAGFMLSPEFGVRVNGGNAFFAPAATAGSAALYTVKLSGPTTSTLSAWVDGVALSTSSVADIPIQTAGNGTVGGWTAAAAGGNNFSGDIAEIIVYGRDLSSSEQQAVEQYLTAKYFASNGTEPDTIAGLQLWLDATNLNGLSAGSAVDSWPDSSSSGHLVTQTSTTNQPTYDPAALNGHPAVHFDGTNDYLSLPANVVAGSQARTVVWVARPSETGNKGLIDLGQGSTTGSAFLVTPEHGVRVMGGNRLWNPGAPTTAPSIGVVILNGGTTTSNLSAWVNGIPLTPAGTTSVQISTSGPGAVGAWSVSPVGPNNFAGDIGELLVYDRALSAVEREMLVQSLALKYGISIS
jgi:hypothetical protein